MTLFHAAYSMPPPMVQPSTNSLSRPCHAPGSSPSASRGTRPSPPCRISSPGPRSIRCAPRRCRSSRGWSNRYQLPGRRGSLPTEKGRCPRRVVSSPKIHCPSCRLAPPMIPPKTPLGENSTGVFGGAATPVPVLKSLLSWPQLRLLQAPAQTAADVEPAPVGDVPRVRHHHAWNSVGSGICRAERERNRGRGRPQRIGD